MTQSEYTYADHERPTFPGSPFSPQHHPYRRIAYVLVAILLGVSATFSNALVTVNLSTLAGSLGLYTEQASWFSAVYVAMNACANLLLIKARTRFGIPAVSQSLLLLYAGMAALQLAAPSFTAALLIRAASGMAAAALTTLTIYHLIQAFPRKIVPAAIVLGVMIPQLGSPLARQVPVELLAFHAWHGLYLIELTVALSALTAILLFPLPPSEQQPAFEWVDFITMLFFVPAILLLCAVLSLGRLLWWHDTAWLGWALVAATILLTIAILIEYRRSNPLLQIKWLSSGKLLRFAAVAMLVRFALAEQTFGAVGLLSASGLNNDQLHLLFAGVVVAILFGGVIAVVTLSADKLPYQIMFGAIFIACGAWLDSQTNQFTSPTELYLSQALIGFGTSLFIGPALLYGMLDVIKQGSKYQISFLVLFSLTQNIGGLLGSALLGSWQTIATRAHTQALTERLLIGDPQVIARIQAGAISLSGNIADPQLRSLNGASLLGQSIAREANTLAFNDVFRIVTLLAALTALYIAYLIILNKIRRSAPPVAVTPDHNSPSSSSLPH